MGCVASAPKQGLGKATSHCYLQITPVGARGALELLRGLSLPTTLCPGLVSLRRHGVIPAASAC